MLDHTISINDKHFEFEDKHKINYINMLEKECLPNEAIVPSRIQRWLTPFKEGIRVKVNGEYVYTILEAILMLYLTTSYKVLEPGNGFLDHTISINNYFNEFEDYSKLYYIRKLERECIPNEAIVPSRFQRWTSPFKEGTNVRINGYKVDNILEAIVMLYIMPTYKVLNGHGFLEHTIKINNDFNEFEDRHKPSYINRLEKGCLQNDDNIPTLIRPFNKEVKINGYYVENILEAILIMYLSTYYDIVY